MRPLILPLLAALVACESGTSELYSFELDDSTIAAFSPEAPGLLRIDLLPSPIFAMCGDEPSVPLQYSWDHGFGCLADELEGEEVSRSAWIEPIPESWDAEALCALAEPDPIWRGIYIDDEVLGDGSLDELAPEAEEDWIQDDATGEWGRDFSPCGGKLDVEFVL